MLEQNLLTALAREQECMVEVLRLLREVERSRLFLERGFSSMYAYCTDFLEYSEPEAQVRIAAMRCPGAIVRIAEGKLSMSVAAEIQGAVRREKLSREQAQELVKEFSGKSKREAERKLAERFPRAAKPEKTKPINGDQVEIRMTVSREDLEAIEKLLDRKSHTNFERSKSKLFVELVRAQLKKFEGNQSEVTPPHGPAKGRYIPAATRRFVWKRDKGRCQYPGCTSRHGLQIDHILEFSKGGTHDPENLRLYCGAHNRSRPI